MQKGLKMDGQMRALAMSLGGAALMAVVAMLIPVSFFESITGATGISELVPATAAPLGDTARAIIAFLFAAGAFAGLAAMLLRQPMKRNTMRPSNVQRPSTVSAADANIDAPIAATPSMFDTMRQKFEDFMASRRKGPVVTDLSDLPKLRAGDAHPDAPPRRPISATRDFGEVDAGPAMPLSQATAPEIPEPVIQPVSVVTTDHMVMEPLAAPEPDELVEAAVETAIAAPTPDIASVNSMVEQLESALTRRQSQLDRLEKLATQQHAQSAPVIAASITDADIPAVATVDEYSNPPALEVVPPSAEAPQAKEEMDEALRSALETLQRMNARSR